MRLFIVGAQPTDEDDLPELPPNEIREIIVAAPVSDPVYLWATSQGVPVTAVVSDPAELSDAILEEISELIEDAKPDDAAIAMARFGDVVFLAWDGSTRRYAQLRALKDRGIGVLDIADGYQELVIDGSPDIDQMVQQITARVTAEVLKVVRQEMQDLMRQRRRRNTPTKGSA